VICAIASIAGHVALVLVLTYLVLGDEPPPPAPQIVQVHVVEPPILEPPPEPVKPPEPVPQEPPKPKLHERPRPQAAQVKHDVTPVDTPPVDRPPTTTDTTTTPVFGVTMESTSQGGSGPAMPVGNTTHAAPAGTGAAVKPLAQPVAAIEVTKMPLPHGRCAGKYTEEALAAGIEGVVVLDVTVDEHGRARDITVVQGLSHGLTDAAIAALSACTFTPGEKAGVPVPVRVRGYKVRFLPPDSP
jgi:TonB family protein